jgi:thiol-disulfide isomerase/thioredoxin
MVKRILTLVLFFYGQLLFAQPKTAGGTKEDYSKPGSAMPPFIITTQDAVQQADANTQYVTHLLTDKDVKNDGNLFVMLFNPTCEHCEDQTTMLEKNMAMFKKTNIVLVCAKSDKRYLNNFLLLTHIRDYPRINVGMDSTDYGLKTFLYSQMPQMNIYDHNRKLLKIFSGTVPIDSLKMYIE